MDTKYDDYTMVHDVVIEELAADGSARELGPLTGSKVLIGREPREGITINNTAISREHGEFIRLRSHWFYKDLGSTNGSWVNGKVVKEGQIRLVRGGDVLQFANVPIRLKELAPSNMDAVQQPHGSTLLVFSGGDLLDEFPMPEYGRALVVGGAKADFKLEGYMSDLPRIVFERRGDQALVMTVGEGPKSAVNNVEFTGSQTLNDGDEIAVGPYTILFNDSRARRAVANESQRITKGKGRLPSGQVVLTETSKISATGEINPVTGSGGSRASFGVAQHDVVGTAAMDPAEIEAQLAGYDVRNVSRRGVATNTGSYLSDASNEDKIIIFLFLGLIFVLVLLVVWWLVL